MVDAINAFLRGAALLLGALVACGVAGYRCQQVLQRDAAAQSRVLRSIPYLRRSMGRHDFVGYQPSYRSQEHVEEKPKGPQSRLRETRYLPALVGPPAAFPRHLSEHPLRPGGALFPPA